MNFKWKLHLLLFFVFILPINVFAYSNKLILGGENIGIHVDASHILVVGFYDVDGKNIAEDAGFAVGDQILKVNNKDVWSIEEMMSEIDNENATFSILRNGKRKDIELTLIKDKEGGLKSGLYVKDNIIGIGTLTYIDPETKIFGALGHEIMEQTTKKKLEIRKGEIFSSVVTDITKSDIGNVGEKNATFDIEDVYGNITSNESSGIFGIYNKPLKDKKIIEVGKKNEIKKGKAQIMTVIDKNNIETFQINIIKIDDKAEVKNVLFELEDEKLKKKTNGIVSGMSGSPILQDGKIVAAVTHAVIQDPMRGYGIFIETMLKEGDKSKE